MWSYKTVYDLTDDEFEELKQTFFWQLMYDDPDGEEVLGDITSWEELPDDAIYYHYDGIDFSEDDFWCNQ